MINLTRTNILRNMGQLLTGTLWSFGITAITTIFIARQLQPTLYGQYATVLVSLTLMALLFSLGLDYWQLQQQTEVAKATTSSIAIKSIIGLVWIGGITGIAWVANWSVFPVTLVVIAGCSLICEEFVQSALGAFKAQLQNHISAYLQLITYGFLFIGTLFLVYRQANTPEAFLWVRLLTFIIGASIALLAVWRWVGWQWQWASVQHAFQQTRVYGLQIIFANLYLQLDVILVAMWLGSTNVGLYTPAIAIIHMSQLLPNTIAHVMLPVLSQQLKHQSQTLWRQSRQLLLMVGILGAIITAGLWFVSPYLVHILYGATYGETAVLLQHLSPILPFKFLNVALIVILVAVGGQVKALWLQAFIVIFNLGLNIYLIPRYGLLGTAYAYLFSEIALTGGYLLIIGIWYTYVFQSTTRPIISSSSTPSV